MAVALALATNVLHCNMVKRCCILNVNGRSSNVSFKKVNAFVVHHVLLDAFGYSIMHFCELLELIREASFRPNVSHFNPFGTFRKHLRFRLVVFFFGFSLALL